MKKRAPGPSVVDMLIGLPRFIRDPLGGMTELPGRYGPTIHLPLRHPTFLLTLPDDIRHVLITNPRNYHKTGGLVTGRGVLGLGLVSSEAPLHTRQRKLMQPMFHRNSISRFGEMMTEETERHIQEWQDGMVLDVSRVMMEITLNIVQRALFSMDARDSARDLSLAFTEAQRIIMLRQLTAEIPLWIPTPSNIRYRRAIAKINQTVFGLIASRRKLSQQPPDLLGMLLDARFEDGSPMPEQQIRDEVATILIAGHETVSNMLSWTFYLISQHPDVEARLHQEWDEVLGGRTPSMSDLPSLRYTDKVFAESLRMFPPAWILARKCVEADRLPSGLELRPRDEVLMSQYVSHRNPEVFPDPERFDPGRWTPEFTKTVSPFVYYPFGAGPRYCIGEQFGRMEAVLVLVTIGQRYRASLVPGHRVRHEPLITLRPKYGLKMRIETRRGRASSSSAAALTGSPSPQ